MALSVSSKPQGVLLHVISDNFPKTRVLGGAEEHLQLSLTFWQKDLHSGSKELCVLSTLEDQCFSDKAEQRMR